MRKRILFLTLLGLSAFAAQVPRKSPEFVVMPPDGKQVLLSSYHGKVVCFLFILTT